MSDIDDLLVDENEETETMTAAEVLEKLEEAWLNEKFCPDLLEAKTDLVDCMLEQIAAMEENIQRAEKGDFKVCIHRMEIDRIRYILSSYLRLRLGKIENYSAHVLEAESKLKGDSCPIMSAGEFAFAKDYQKTLSSHFTTLALRHMPANLQNLTHEQTVVKPNLDSYVFFRVNENTDGVLVEEETLDTGEEIVDLQKNDQHIMKYRPIASLVNSGAVSLI